MLDIKLIRSSTTEVATNLAKRGFELDTEYLQQLEASRKELQIELEALQAKRNQISKLIGQKKAKQEDASSLMQEVKQVTSNLDEISEKYRGVQQELDSWLLHIPNLLHSSVPAGKSEADNVVIKTWGEKPEFDFSAKEHHILLPEDKMNLALGAKIAGTRFCVLKGSIARLHRALAQFMLDTHTSMHGYEEVNVPHLVHTQSLQNTGQLPKLADDSYKVDSSDYWLIPTSEVPVTNFVSDTILDAEQLPLKFVCHSSCFRSEAGSYGKDIKGIFRQHQFEKVEMIQIVEPDKSYSALEQMLGHATKILELLEIHYRVVNLCSGDIGFSAAKTYDVEVWLPGQNCYREISSCSNTESFQARRMQARYKKDGKINLLHTLNGSGLAVGRTLIAVVENYQTIDNKIVIPKVLRPYMGNQETIDL